MATISVDQKACIRCGACVDVCNIARVFELDEGGSVAVRPEACWNCGQCVAVCPTDAIDHDGFPLEDCPMIGEKDIPSIEELTTAYRARRSCRTFEEKPVPREILRELVSLARWAPTAQNSQSFDWVAFDDSARINELSTMTVGELGRFVRLARNPLAVPFVRLIAGRGVAKELRKAKPLVDGLAEKLAQGQDPVFYHAPVVLIGHSPAANNFGRDDAIFAAYNLMLAADHFGLGTCQIGFFQIVYEKSRRLQRKTALPDGRKAQVVLALGYARHSFRRALPRRSPNLSWNPR